MGLFNKNTTENKAKFTDLKDVKINEALTTVFNALKDKGYNPYTQIMYYLYSEDETNITNNNNARSIITSIDRDDLMQHILHTYFDN